MASVSTRAKARKGEWQQVRTGIWELATAVEANDGGTAKLRVTRMAGKVRPDGTEEERYRVLADAPLVVPAALAAENFPSPAKAMEAAEAVWGKYPPITRGSAGEEAAWADDVEREIEEEERELGDEPAGRAQEVDRRERRVDLEAIRRAETGRPAPRRRAAEARVARAGVRTRPQAGERPERAAPRGDNAEAFSFAARLRDGEWLVWGDGPDGAARIVRARATGEGLEFEPPGRAAAGTRRKGGGA